MQLLYQLSKNFGKTLVTSLHAFEYARSHYQRIVGLRQGVFCLMYQYKQCHQQWLKLS